MKATSKILLVVAAGALVLAGFVITGAGIAAPTAPANEDHVPADASVAYFASGCFWCVEAVYESVEGVYEAVSGYAGGQEKNPTYEQVSRGRSSHAEAVKVYYDPNLVTFATLVDVFFGSQDPTQVNGQGPDRGSQYRSIIFYSNDEEKAIAAEIVALDTFWRAEDYHQNYERNNPNNPYVRNVSIPRLHKFQAKFPELLKDGHDS